MAIWGRPTGHQATPPVRREEKTGDARREYLWNTPDGDKPDFAETYTHGDEVVFSWNALNNSIYDLWLTSWKPGPDPVAVCLAINLAHDGNLKLVTSDPPTAQFANETKYVLRFKPPTGRGEFVASDPDLSSPGFLLVEPAFHQQDVPSTTSPAMPTISRVTPARETATTMADSGSEEPFSNISPAAAAGLTIGLILMVALLVAGEVWYLMWRRKRRRGGGDDGTTPASSRWRMKRFGKGDRGVFVRVGKAEMVIDDSIWMSPELPGDSTWGERLVHELQGSRLGRGNPLSRPLTINSSVVELDVGREVVMQRGNVIGG
ncbi:hypothetical protein F5144DRAFT_210323 [Chaetomium tenue]|uniref:Uncharacterized protein n=1 Tax=Chaetomium tenue TaxID=1854479 RepID=A0ACB7PG24_9PEZI|nr:hypothetical protein F5144DRAFT_210323 [Chaetomium globosum]